MKHIILTLFVLLALPLFSGVGPDKPTSVPSLFEVDEAEVEEAFADLDALEQYLHDNPDATLEEMQAEGNELVAEVDQINGLDVSNALADGGLSTLAIVLIVVGSLILIGLCCLVIAALGYY